MPWLGTAGRFIVESETRKRVLLHGVNLSGLEYVEPGADGFLKAARFTRDEIRYLTRDFGCNLIRIPFNQDWALRGRGAWSAESYLEALDTLMRWACEEGAYSLLDLQWLDADTERGGPRQFVAPLPVPDSVTLWRLLSARYRDCPWVLFDLFNEPHHRLPGDPLRLQRPDGRTYLWPWKRKVGPAEWKPWAETLIDAIREVHPRALIFVAGTNWAYDLRGMRLQRENVVYSTHVYPDKKPSWQQAFGDFAETAPVFVGELGGEEMDLAWGNTLLRYLDERQIGWCAWSWRDRPFLQKDGQLTPFGRLIHKPLLRYAMARRQYQCAFPGGSTSA
jgi:endoglucanase